MSPYELFIEDCSSGVCSSYCMFFFFFKQKTAYEMRISDWSSDVCSSDLGYNESWIEGVVVLHNPNSRIPLDPDLIPGADHEFLMPDGSIMSMLPDLDRKSVV